MSAGGSWFSGTPSSWSVVRTKYLFNREQRPVSPDDDVITAFRDGQVTLRRNRRTEGFTNSEKEIGYQGIRAGDLVVHAMDAFAGAIGMSDSDGKSTPVYSVCTPRRPDVFTPYYARLLRHMALSGFVESLSKGIRERSTEFRWAELGEVDLPVPPKDRQELIANFLDAQTERIDALTAEKEALVDRLLAYQYSYISQLMTRGLNSGAETKKTSFPEIGEIPIHWTVKRLKVLGEIRSGIAKGKDLAGRDSVRLPYLRVANVQAGYVDLSEVSEIEVPESEATRYLLRKNDVLMNEGGDNDKLGRGTVWQGQIDPCIHQNHVFAVRLFDPGLAEWVSRFTSTDAARAYFFLRSKQSTNLASINQTNVRELPVPMPPEPEREEIFREILRMTKATTDLVDHAVEHIDRLREYRSSLISAAVTGQLDVDTSREMG